MHGKVGHRHGRSREMLRPTPDLLSSRLKSEGADISERVDDGSSRLRLRMTYTAVVLGSNEGPVWMIQEGYQ